MQKPFLNTKDTKDTKEIQRRLKMLNFHADHLAPKNIGMIKKDLCFCFFSLAGSARESAKSIP
ncbi:MAG: hypothetical protein COS37_00580 [Anaerolineae bacterium CG03_land_8_20_14_0_80_58_20]|nr:MAG: hypothetical protein COS37_00580 [Anaerolineae bacterium CG03_land_8_20_14_0_80_58_20]